VLCPINEPGAQLTKKKTIGRLFGFMRITDFDLCS